MLRCSRSPRFVCRALLSLAVAVLGAGAVQVGAAAEPGAAEGGAPPSESAAEVSPTVARCVQSHLAGQELRQNGELLESRSEFLACAQESCPALVQSECLGFLDELRAEIPSLVFRITVDGERRPEVMGFVDGRPLFSELPSRALELDPGKYRFRFEHGHMPPIERELTITAGDKFIPIDVAFVSAPKRERHQPASKESPELSRPLGWPVYALGGLGVAGIGAFIGFGLATRSRENNLRYSCSPACSKDEIDSVRRLATVADVSLAIGGASLAAAAGYFYFRPAEPVRVGATVLPAGGVKSELQVAF